MGRYSFRDIRYGHPGDFKELKFKGHPLEGRYVVMLGNEPCGHVFKTRNGDWGSLPFNCKRGRPINGFATQHYAAVYCMWASGIIPEDQTP